jgi:hypothetical protein
MSTAAVNPSDPYAAYGGATAPPAPTSSADPYAAYGGASGAATPPPAATTTTTPPAADEDSLGTQAGEAAEGFKKALNQTGLTAMKVIHAVPGVGAALDKTGWQKAQTATQTVADQPMETTAGKTGYAVENIIEFMSGEEALKGLSLGEKLAKMAPMIKQLEKYPLVANMLNSAIRQGTVGTAQAAAHGEGAGDSAVTGLATGVMGGAAELIPGAQQGVKNLLAKVRPGTVDIAGVTIPRLASQVKDASPLAAKLATTANTPAYAAAQQTLGQQAVENTAQRATREALERVNAVRQTVPPITDPARMLQAPDGSQPFQFTLEGTPTTERVEGDISPDPRKKQIGNRTVAGKGSATAPTEPYAASSFKYGDGDYLPQPSDLGTQPEGSHKEPLLQYFTGTKLDAEAAAHDIVGGGGRMTTGDPQQAQSWLSRYDDLTNSAQFEQMPATQQAHITSQRDSLEQQLGMYNAADRMTPNFDPVDTAAAAQHVSNFGEAADQIQQAVKPIYQKLDDLSGGQFTALRNQSRAAAKVMFQPGSMDAYSKALDAKAEADEGIQNLFNRHGGDISRAELTSANSAWRDSVALDNIHAAINGAFKGAPKDIAEANNTARLLKGDSMVNRLNTLMAKDGARANTERVIGKNGLADLYNVGGLVSNPATAGQTGSALRAVGLHMFQHTTRGAVVGGLIGSTVGHPYLGAVGGALTEDAAHFVLRQAAINPRVGTLLDYAVRNKVNPRIFAPLIAATINANQTATPAPETQP